jgi:hypothetical protein
MVRATSPLDLMLMLARGKRLTGAARLSEYFS